MTTPQHYDVRDFSDISKIPFDIRYNVGYYWLNPEMTELDRQLISIATRGMKTKEEYQLMYDIRRGKIKLQDGHVKNLLDKHFQY